jgi:hypothetical protein
VGDENATDRRGAARNPGTPARRETPETDGASAPIGQDHDATLGTEIENESDESLEH